MAFTLFYLRAFYLADRFFPLLEIPRKEEFWHNLKHDTSLDKKKREEGTSSGRGRRGNTRKYRGRK